MKNLKEAVIEIMAGSALEYQVKKWCKRHTKKYEEWKQKLEDAYFDMWGDQTEDLLMEYMELLAKYEPKAIVNDLDEIYMASEEDPGSEE